MHLWTNCAQMAPADRMAGGWGTMNKRIAVSVSGLAIAVALAGCSAKSATQATTTTAVAAVKAPATTVPNVQSLLLSITDLPTGWTVDNSPNNSGSLSCLPASLSKGAASHAEVDFQQGGGLPVLDESIGFYASAQTTFATAVKALNGCKTFTTTGSGTNYSGSLGAMSSPTYGDQSAAYNANLTVQGLNINEGFIVVRKGSYIALVVLGDVGSLDSPTLQGFVTQAVAKIPGATP
jgi:hypothetical protein